MTKTSHMPLSSFRGRQTKKFKCMASVMVKGLVRAQKKSTEIRLENRGGIRGCSRRRKSPLNEARDSKDKWHLAL